MEGLESIVRRGKGALSDRQVARVRKWLEADWESHDVDRDAVALIRRLVLTVDGLRGTVRKLFGGPADVGSADGAKSRVRHQRRSEGGRNVRGSRA